MSLASRLEGRLGSKAKVHQLIKDHDNLERRLQEIMDFLMSKEPLKQADATHVVLGDFRPTSKKLVIVEEQLKILAMYIVELHDMGVPLTLAELWSTEARLAQDIVIRGSCHHNIIKAAELVDDHHPLMLLMGQIMGEMYGEFITQRSQGMFLDAAFFDSSGKSDMTGAMETVVRIVWQTIIVTRLRAQTIRDHEKTRLQQRDREGIIQFLQKAEELHQDNTPNNILPDTISMTSEGILMPLNDRVNPPPRRVPEGRPLRPMFMKRFHYAVGGKLQKIERMDTDHLEGQHWVSLGLTRQGDGTELTPWKQPPAFQDRSGPLGVQQTRAGGQVRHIRSVGGSPGDHLHRHRRRAPQNAVRQPLPTCMREFLGTPAEFKQILIQKFGDEGIAEDEGCVSWTGPNGQKVQLVAGSVTQRVHITGQEMHLREMVDRLRDHLSAVGGRAKAVVSGQTAARTSTQATSAASSYAPSEVHRRVAQASAPSVLSTVAARVASAVRAGGGTGTENTRRRVTKAYPALGDGDLDLAVDDVVVIMEDPVDFRHHYHRTVKGFKEFTSECGWFPLSCTEEISNAGAAF